MLERKDLLQRVITLDGRLAYLGSELKKFKWDSKSALVTLSRGDIKFVLEKYLNNNISLADLEEWANILEGRDDVDFEKTHEELIHSIINELANPLLTRPLNRQTANELILQLQ